MEEVVAVGGIDSEVVGAEAVNAPESAWMRSYGRFWHVTSGLEAILGPPSPSGSPLTLPPPEPILGDCSTEHKSDETPAGGVVEGVGTPPTRSFGDEVSDTLLS